MMDLGVIVQFCQSQNHLEIMRRRNTYLADPSTASDPASNLNDGPLANLGATSLDLCPYFDDDIVAHSDAPGSRIIGVLRCDAKVGSFVNNTSSAD